ncbi:MAG: glycosyltransferase family 4 protein, partial [Limisphaerales bacterium]
TERDCAIDAVLSGFPNIITIHGNMRIIASVSKARPFSYLWFAAKLEGLTVPRSRGVVCITHHTQRAISGLARRSWIVPNAVDGSFFDIENRPAAARQKVLCIGVVCALKNQSALMRALDPLAQKVDFELVFLGNGRAEDPYFAEFRHLVAARPWCIHGGFASREQLKKHLREASLLVLPSYEDNCPMVVLEAMAAGVPVVASAVGGVPELIENGETGLLCDCKDPLNLRSKVEGILSDPRAGRRMALLAKANALGKFHPRIIARRHVEIYREVLELAAARPERYVTPTPAP